jgi:hypothetical protein
MKCCVRKGKGERREKGITRNGICHECRPDENSLSFFPRFVTVHALAEEAEKNRGGTQIGVNEKLMFPPSVSIPVSLRSRGRAKARPRGKPSFHAKARRRKENAQSTARRRPPTKPFARLFLSSSSSSFLCAFASLRETSPTGSLPPVGRERLPISQDWEEPTTEARRTRRKARVGQTPRA